MRFGAPMCALHAKWTKNQYFLILVWVSIVLSLARATSTPIKASLTGKHEQVASMCHASFKGRVEYIDLRCFLQPENVASALHKRGFPSLILDSERDIVTSFQELGSQSGLLTDASITIETGFGDDLDTVMTSDEGAFLVEERLNSLDEQCRKRGLKTQRPKSLVNALTNLTSSVQATSKKALSNIEQSDLTLTFITIFNNKTQSQASGSSPSLMSTTCFPASNSDQALSDKLVSSVLAAFSEKRSRLIGTVAAIKSKPASSSLSEQEACIQTTLSLSEKSWDLERQISHFVTVHRAGLRVLHDLLTSGIYDSDTNDSSLPNVVTVLGASKDDANGLYVYAGFRIEGSKAYVKVRQQDAPEKANEDTGTVGAGPKKGDAGVIFKARIPSNASSTGVDEFWVIAASFPRNEQTAGEQADRIRAHLDSVDPVPEGSSISVEEKHSLNHLQAAISRVAEDSFPEMWYVLTQDSSMRARKRSMTAEQTRTTQEASNNSSLALTSEGWLPTHLHHGLAPILEFDPLGTEGVLAAQRLLHRFGEHIGGFSTAADTTRAKKSLSSNRKLKKKMSKHLSKRDLEADSEFGSNLMFSKNNVLTSPYTFSSNIKKEEEAAEKIKGTSSTFKDKRKEAKKRYVIQWLRQLRSHFEDSLHLFDSKQSSESQILPDQDSESTSDSSSKSTPVLNSALQAEADLKQDIENTKLQLRSLLSSEKFELMSNKVAGGLEPTDEDITATLDMLVGEVEDFEEDEDEKDSKEDDCGENCETQGVKNEALEAKSKKFFNDLIAQAIAADAYGAQNVLEQLDGMIIRAETAAAAAAAATVDAGTPPIAETSKAVQPDSHQSVPSTTSKDEL